LVSTSLLYPHFIPSCSYFSNILQVNKLPLPSNFQPQAPNQVATNTHFFSALVRRRLENFINSDFPWNENFIYSINHHSFLLIEHDSQELRAESPLASSLSLFSVSQRHFPARSHSPTPENSYKNKPNSFNFLQALKNTCRKAPNVKRR